MYMCQKLWKLADNRQSYCKNHQACFFGAACISSGVNILLQLKPALLSICRQVSSMRYIEELARELNAVRSKMSPYKVDNWTVNGLWYSVMFRWRRLSFFVVPIPVQTILELFTTALGVIRGSFPHTRNCMSLHRHLKSEIIAQFSLAGVLGI